MHGKHVSKIPICTSADKEDITVNEAVGGKTEIKSVTTDDNGE